MTLSVGLIGARGYTGRELLRLLAGHPGVEIAFAVSRSAAGESLDSVAPDAGLQGRFEDLSPEDAAARGADVVFLLTPNGETPPWVSALEDAASETILIDVSADHRFEETWVYGLPEHHREALKGARRIANPGCYATALQLAAKPLLPFVTAPPHGFGVSGYSGAGSTPSPRNDAARLKDSLMPYKLTGHVHQREAERHLGTGVRFVPHVAGFFRGLSVTVSTDVSETVTTTSLRAAFDAAYGHEPLIGVQEEPPEIRDRVGHHGALVGGFQVCETGRSAAVVCVLDNLLKGAASQALQNLNLAAGLPEMQGLIT